MAPLCVDPVIQLEILVLDSSNIVVPVDFAIVGKLAQTVFSGYGTIDTPFETYAFQFLDSGERYRRCLAF
jgi:hypothetical protein